MTPPLHQALAAGDTGLVLLVDLAEQVELTALARSVSHLPRRQRRRQAVAALGTVSARSWVLLAPLLERLRQDGDVKEVERFRVVNRLVLHGATRRAVAELAKVPAVARVDVETRDRQPLLQRATGAPGHAAPWALQATGVSAAWSQGLSGKGIVVGLLDSGASSLHEQLAPGFRGGSHSWHDPAHGSPTPRDRALGHGSGVLSVALGRNVRGIELGVAPGATWVACAAFPEGRFRKALLTACADWLLTVAQPDVVVNAWLLPDGADPCDPSLRRLVEAWRTAEILPVFAAGNLGESGGNRPPANYADLAPDGGTALSVGGLARDGDLLPVSAVGPSRCSDAVFPSLVAPAEDLQAALPAAPDLYVDAEGTSFATALVAGAAALLYERFPEATVGEVETALRHGAVDLGPEGPDERFGWGRLDVPRALAALEGLVEEGRTAGGVHTRTTSDHGAPE